MAKLHHWLAATRPKTLPASIVPVGVASALAFSHGSFYWFYSVVALICAVLIQIITNFINEYYDFKRGADTEERLGPLRAVASGIIKPKDMALASLILIILTFFIGLILVARGGWIILAAGVSSLLFAWAYTGGPYPLAYKGIADVFVFIFFGLVAVSGTYYVQTLDYNLSALLAGIPPGLISMNILGVNNIRDITTDSKAGKITLAVRLGRKNAISLYYVLNALAFLVPGLLALFENSWWNLLPFAAIPYSIKLCKDLSEKTGKDLNSVLSGTGKLLLLHGLLTSVGFIL